MRARVLILEASVEWSASVSLGVGQLRGFTAGYAAKVEYGLNQVELRVRPPNYYSFIYMREVGVSYGPGEYHSGEGFSVQRIGETEGETAQSEGS